MGWRNSASNEKGWSASFSQSFRQIAQDDDMSNSGGRGIGRDRRQFTFNGALQRRINEYLHASLVGNYYFLEYDNDVNKYANLYGWKRASLGGEVGFAPTKWTDFIVHATHQWYWQDNDGGDARIGSESRGYTIQAGIGSHASERITYRALAGMSHFDYGNGTHKSNGFTYQLSGKWLAGDSFSVIALGSSHYQPSERDYGASLKVYTFSLGMRKGFVRNKLSGTLDFAYRYETHDYSVNGSADYDTDIWTARVGLNYTLNRFFTIYGRLEYQTSEASRTGTAHAYDYDRIRGTVGVRLTY